jgi:hypothetical protein
LGIEETSFYLFFECPFHTSCWNYISMHWDQNPPPLDITIEARTAFGNPIFREIVITTCCTIWILRNGLIFDNKPCNIHSWKLLFKEQLGLVCAKLVKPSIEGPLRTIWKESVA